MLANNCTVQGYSFKTIEFQFKMSVVFVVVMSSESYLHILFYKKLICKKLVLNYLTTSHGIWNLSRTSVLYNYPTQLRFVGYNHLGAG